MLIIGFIANQTAKTASVYNITKCIYVNARYLIKSRDTFVDQQIVVKFGKTHLHIGYYPE